MKIDKTVELEDGSVTFKGELAGTELDVVLQYGLNTLLALGALKTTLVAPKDEDDDGESETTLQ